MASGYLTLFQSQFYDFIDIIPHRLMEATCASAIGQTDATKATSDQPHIVCVGPSPSMHILYIKEYIRRLFHLDHYPRLTTQTHTITSNNQKYEVVIRVSDYYKMMDFSTLRSADKTAISSIIRPWIQEPHYYTKRHIIILSNADQLSYNAWMCLRRIMEDTAYHVQFIFDATHLSKIPGPIQSRTSLWRVPLVPKETIRRLVERLGELIEDGLASLQPPLADQLALYDAPYYDPIDIFLRLDASAGTSLAPHEPWTEYITNTLISLKQCRTFWSAYEKIQEWTAHWIKTGIPHVQVFHLLTRALTRLYPKEWWIPDILHQISEADVALLTSSRPQFAYDAIMFALYEKMTDFSTRPIPAVLTTTEGPVAGTTPAKPKQKRATKSKKEPETETEATPMPKKPRKKAIASKKTQPSQPITSVSAEPVEAECCKTE